MSTGRFEGRSPIRAAGALMPDPATEQSLGTGAGLAQALSLVVALGLLFFAADGLDAQADERSGAVAADSTAVSIGLEEALRRAVDRNRDVEVARTGLDEAEEQVSEAWSSVYPSVDFSAGYSRNVSPQVSFLPARIFDPTAEEGTFLPIQFGADNSWQTSITLEQPIFRASAFIGVGAAGRFRELQEEVLRGSVQEAVTGVRIGYYDLLLAQEEVRLTENSLDRVRASLEETRALHEAGLASDFDVLRLEVELANLEPSLRRARNAVSRARRDLAVDLDVDDASTLRVEGSLAELDLESLEANRGANREIVSLMGVEVGPGTDASSLVDRAMDRRTEIIQADATADLRQAELRVEQVEYLPEVALTGSYSIQAQQNGTPDFFGSGSNRAYARTVGLRVSLPLFTGFRRDALIDRRQAVLRGARIQARLLRDQARNEVLQYVDDVEEARLRAVGQALAVGQAERGYEIASAEYAEGVTGRLQLTDAEVALRETEFNYAEAVYDYLVARANLDRAVGVVPVADPSR